MSKHLPGGLQNKPKKLPRTEPQVIILPAWNKSIDVYPHLHEKPHLVRSVEKNLVTQDISMMTRNTTQQATLYEFIRTHTQLVLDTHIYIHHIRCTSLPYSTLHQRTVSSAVWT